MEWEEFCHLMADYIQKEAAREESKIVEGKEATDEEYDVAMQAFRMFDINGGWIWSKILIRWSSC